MKGMAKAEKDSKVDRILDMFDLTEFADRRADRLSGGQRRRLTRVQGEVLLRTRTLRRRTKTKTAEQRF